MEKKILSLILGLSFCGVASARVADVVEDVEYAAHEAVEEAKDIAHDVTHWRYAPRHRHHHHRHHHHHD